jgi:Membrane bound beta barrel domain (DUF5777)
MFKNIQKTAFIALSLGFAATAFAQKEDSLLDDLGADSTVTEYATNAFKSTRVVNSQSMEMLGLGVLDFRILHRFGKLSGGTYEFFGLDNASMRIGFDYGIVPNLMVGIGRTTSKKELDGFLKYRLLWQSAGKKTMPVSVLGVSGFTYNGLKQPFDNIALEATFERRLAFYQQIIVGRKFSDNFSLQVTPTYLHRNVVQNVLNSHDMFALGIGGRLKCTRRMALVWDYTHAFNRFPDDPTFDPLTLGVDIETGGHVFQLHFSNAVGMNERAFIADNNGNWFGGEIQFGFNLSRVFQVYSPK